MILTTDFRKIMRVHTFDRIKRKGYYSPDFYLNMRLFSLPPRENALVMLGASFKSHQPTYKCKFTCCSTFLKHPGYKLAVVVKNLSFRKKLICRNRCTLTTLLATPKLKHDLVFLTSKDIVQARRHKP
jgi:hypothetical protein